MKMVNRRHEVHVLMLLHLLNPDVNECDVNDGGCDHYCINLMGTFKCQCREGYKLGTDGKSCEGIH